MQIPFCFGFVKSKLDEALKRSKVLSFVNIFQLGMNSRMIKETVGRVMAERCSFGRCWERECLRFWTKGMRETVEFVVCRRVGAHGLLVKEGEVPNGVWVVGQGGSFSLS